jgi:aminoglycoside phosphotransferase (APT) family kinase protein
MRRLHQPLRRTAMAISLDRISAATLAQRLRIASMRLLGREPEAALLAEYRAFTAPLLCAPKAMIHNSMSPLNIAVAPDGGLRAIDWETLTLASPLWDWAEMLRAPYNAPSLDETASLVRRLFPADDTIDMFRRAVLSRHLDSLATVVQRRRLYEAEGRADRAAEYARRAAFYADDLDTLLDLLKPAGEVARSVREMARAGR